VAAGRQAEAVEAYDVAIADLGEHGADLALELDAEAANAARMVRLERPRMAERHGRRPARFLGERMVLAELAHDRAIDGGPAGDVAALARAALEGGELAVRSSHAGPVWDAILALIVADELDLAEHHLEGLLVHGRRHGSLVAIAGASALRAFSAMQRGDVAKTASEAQAALDAAQGGLGLLLAMGSAYLAHALIERGELDDAARVLGRALPAGAVPDDVVFDHLLFERARWGLAAGRASRALEDLRLLDAHVANWQPNGAEVVPHLPGLQHRALTAVAMARLGDHDGARTAAEEELTFARKWDTPRATGVALRALGVLQGGDPGIDILTEAVAQLARSPARLEHAHALVDLGAALRRAGRQAEARQRLGEGMDGAHRCGALALAERARRELGLVGARPRRLALTGVDSLTPGEYRVCELAAEGMTNKEIAQALFVTLRTVEGHLSNAYAKLGIASRAALKTALRARPG
jgi:DNA-binding CsgD family transcriptional regulator